MAVKKHKLTMEDFRFVCNQIEIMAESSRINDNHGFIQHGTTSVFTHCKNVALFSLKIARKYKSKVDVLSLVHGALLHDYFLYDWHHKDNNEHRLHGYRHPKTALRNASKVFDLNDIEKDIIIHHMFPLTLVPPKTREGWIITWADKCCSLYETFKMNEKHLKKRKRLILKRMDNSVVLRKLYTIQ